MRHSLNRLSISNHRYVPLSGDGIQTALLSRLPVRVEEVGMRELLLDALQEPPARGGIGDVVASRAASVTPRVELANNASDAIFDVPDEGARVSRGCEGADVFVEVVYAEFGGLDAIFVTEE